MNHIYLLCIDIAMNMTEIVIKFYKVVQVYINRVRWANYTLAVRKFSVVYVCKEI